MNKLAGAIVQKEQSFFSEQIYKMINREEIYYGIIFFSPRTRTTCDESPREPANDGPLSY